MCRVWLACWAMVLIAGLVLTTCPGHAAEAPGQASAGPAEGFLYFRDRTGEHLRAVSKFFPAGLDAHELGLALLEAVMAGPPSKDLVPVFPAGSRVNALFITQDGDAYVDVGLPGGRLAGADTLSEILGVYSLVNSLTLNIPEIKRVKLLVNGAENSSLGGHVSLAPFFMTNMLIVK